MMEDVAISADSLGTFEMFSVPLLRDVIKFLTIYPFGLYFG